MTTAQFNVVVDGRLLPGFDRDAVLAQLQTQLKLSAAKAEQLVAGKPVVVKRDVTAAVAQSYCARLRALGVDARRVEISNGIAPAASRATANPLQALPAPLPQTGNSVGFRSALYRATLRLLGIAGAYILLCLLALGVTGFYLFHFAYLLTAPPVLFSATIYLLPAFALVIFCALLLRPFLPATPRASDAVAITDADQPGLAAFIERLCAALAVNTPTEMALNAHTDTSAAPLPGIKNFWAGRYRLMLSLPLLQATSINVYAGIVGGYLRTSATAGGLHYLALLQLIRYRAARCTAGTDWLYRRIDALLTKTERLHALRQGARFLFGQSNTFLKQFVQQAEAADIQFARARLREQDRYFAQLAGSAALVEALLIAEKLAIAANDALAKNTEDRIDAGLVDNLPALIRHYYDSLDEKFEREARRRWNTETIPRRGAPPIARERMEQITKTAAAINISDPAATLLDNADFHAMQITLQAYRAANHRFAVESLLPTEDVAYAATQDIQQRQQAAVYFNNWFKPFRFWKLAEYKLIREMPLQDAAEQLSVCVNEIRRLTPDRAKLLTEYERLQNQLFEILIAQHVLAAGRKFSFRYISYDGTSLQPVLEDRQRQLGVVAEKLVVQETVMGGRITLGLRLCGQSEYDISNLHDAMRLLHDSGARLHKLQLDVYQLEQLIPRHYQRKEADYSTPIKRLEEKIGDVCTLLLVRLSDIPCPLDVRHNSLRTYVEAALDKSTADYSRSPIAQRARRLLDILFQVNEKLSLLAAEYGTTAEEAYRIEPIKLVSAE